jgi:hypothetical protein
VSKVRTALSTSPSETTTRRRREFIQSMPVTKAEKVACSSACFVFKSTEVRRRSNSNNEISVLSLPAFVTTCE